MYIYHNLRLLKNITTSPEQDAVETDVYDEEDDDDVVEEEREDIEEQL